MREWLVVYLKGFFMGTADTVPGVSGGTIALITGIYDRLVTAITALDPWHLRTFARVHTADGRADAVETARRIDLPFLVVLGTGIISAVVTVSRVLAVAVERYPAVTAAFFFGLIGASAVVLYREVSIDTPGRIAVGIAGVVVAAGIAGVTGGDVPHALPVVFVAGAIAVAAMVLPGVSGAFLLLLLGQYEYMLTELSTFTDAVLAVVQGADPGRLLAPGTTVIVFVSGAVVGLLTVAHAIRWALDNYREATITLLVSLMVGGLRLPGEQALAGLTGPTRLQAATVATAFLGALAVFLADHATGDLSY